MLARDWLTFAKRFLPAHEAEQILERTLGISPEEQRLSRDRPIDAKRYDILISKMRRRALGEPLQYALGDAPFFGRYFEVTPDVLIPRPETEVLVQSVLDWTSGRTLRGAELGIGSGCISLSLLLEIPKLTMMASDVSEAALDVTRRNVGLHRLDPARLSLVQSDGQMFEVFKNNAPFDFIVSNPPYLSTSDELGLGVASYEPHLALFSDGNVSSFYLNAAQNLESLVHETGAGFFEVPHERASQIESYFKEFGYHTHMHADLTGRARVLQVTRTKEPLSK